MNVASADTIAQRVFLQQLRDNPVALRSRMDRDDIEAIEIVPMTDLDVAATRQVMKLAAPADGTGEIDASDVLEAIDIVDVLPPRAPFVPDAFVVPARVPPVSVVAAPVAQPSVAPAHVTLPPVSSAFVPPAPPAPHGASVDYEDDAYFAGAEHVSTNAVTFNLSEELEPDQEPELVERRSLGWIVATVLAAAAALVIGAVVAEHFPAGTSAVAVAPPAAPQLPAPPVPARASAAGATGSTALNALPTTAVPTMDVKNLPLAKVGTIVGPTRHPFFIDGARATGSTAVVACGKHIVRIGTSRKTHAIDVPCGGQVAVR